VPAKPKPVAWQNRPQLPASALKQVIGGGITTKAGDYLKCVKTSCTPTAPAKRDSKKPTCQTGHCGGGPGGANGGSTQITAPPSTGTAKPKNQQGSGKTKNPTTYTPVPKTDKKPTQNNHTFTPVPKNDNKPTGNDKKPTTVTTKNNYKVNPASKNDNKPTKTTVTTSHAFVPAPAPKKDTGKSPAKATADPSIGSKSRKPASTPVVSNKLFKDLKPVPSKPAAKPVKISPAPKVTKPGSGINLNVGPVTVKLKVP
jgi:hypothetical protein